MRPALCLSLALILTGQPAGAGPAQRVARMDDYLAIWAHDADVTRETVGRLYARRVDYYGRPMSRDAVFRDKLAFVRRWPLRSYAAVPGSVSNDCAAGSRACRVMALMRWTRGDRAGRTETGTNTVRLDLGRDEGTLKIVRESGSAADRVSRPR